MESCQRRNYVPVVHTYPGQVFVTVHAPLLGSKGHVHLLELDLIIGEHVLVTVHGPINPDLDHAVALVETDAVRARLDAGRMSPEGPADLAYAVTSAVARRQSALIHEIAERLPGLEKEVMTSRLRSPEELLERMFLIRHELMTGRTMAAQCHEVWARIAGLGRFAREGRPDQAADLADQFSRVRSLADGETMFLVAVIELYQTKVHTKMTVAMERLAVIAAVTLPVTALASIYGMNVIVNDETHWRRWSIIVLRDDHGQRPAAALGPQAGLVVTDGAGLWPVRPGRDPSEPAAARKARIASRGRSRSSGPWVNAATSYSSSPRRCAVCCVIRKSLQNALTGQRSRRTLKIASPVTRTPELSWRYDAWPGEWPGVCTTRSPPATSSDLSVMELLGDLDRRERAAARQLRHQAAQPVPAGATLPARDEAGVVGVDADAAAGRVGDVPRPSRMVGVRVREQQPRHVARARADRAERGEDLLARLLEAHVEHGDLSVVVAEQEPVDEVAHQRHPPDSRREQDDGFLGHALARYPPRPLWIVPTYGTELAVRNSVPYVMGLSRNTSGARVRPGRRGWRGWRPARGRGCRSWRARW